MNRFASSYLYRGGALLALSGFVAAFPLASASGFFLASLAAIAAYFVGSEGEDEEQLFLEDESNYEVPDELREMPEFAPIGGYRHSMSREPVRKHARPKLTVVE